MEKVISIKDLNFYYGNKKALINVNMDIEKNKVIALIGPSGCGKSTFLRCINRMNDLIDNVRYKGSINFEGNEILELKDTTLIRKDIGMVFQKPNPFPKSIYENIIYAPKRFGLKDKAYLDKLVETSLEEVGLANEVKGLLRSSAFDLSGGQQQRLCIARAIAATPKVILMDEPTSALDPVATKKIEELILKLKKDYTVVIVTHDMGQAYRISDYTGFFLNGELVEFDETEKIFKSAKKRETKDYIAGIFG
ncbi:phosphate ABC transporter ATP-binding protein PstB [uncultured Clostridium sp.]|uniref:phosphate ABC transporter ATP-binding protein PstB n=1 Tax=uncultured Clostridium sp. TaxID=59620 RepID=UPI00261C1D57|nr:phosphate ABC transporter ATP-binding protein PstB [uncultured Clostridium sp.]